MRVEQRSEWAGRRVSEWARKKAHSPTRPLAYLPTHLNHSLRCEAVKRLALINSKPRIKKAGMDAENVMDTQQDRTLDRNDSISRCVEVLADVAQKVSMELFEESSQEGICVLRSLNRAVEELVSVLDVPEPYADTLSQVRRMLSKAEDREKEEPDQKPIHAMNQEDRDAISGCLGRLSGMETLLVRAAMEDPRSISKRLLQRIHHISEALVDLLCDYHPEDLESSREAIRRAADASSSRS